MQLVTKFNRTSIGQTAADLCSFQSVYRATRSCSQSRLVLTASVPSGLLAHK